MIRLMTLLRTIVIAALLTLGLLASAPVVAQDEDPVDEVTDVVEEEDDGFDDWGLLGLLGLAGLAGLMRRSEPDRAPYTTPPTTTRTDDRIDDSTL